MNEIFKTIPFAKRYEVSNFGTIRNKETGRIMGQSFCNKGYLQVCIVLDKYKIAVTVKVHRIVAETFIGNKKGHVIDHIDNTKTNNCVSNLKYVTNRFNIVKQKLHQKGGICRRNIENKYRISYKIEYRKNKRRYAFSCDTEIECVIHYCHEMINIDPSVVGLLENHYGFDLLKQIS